MRRVRWALTVVVLVATGCSNTEVTFGNDREDSNEARVEELIAGPGAELVGIRPLRGECETFEDPLNADAGILFRCTGTAEDGRVIEFGVVADADGDQRLLPLNVLFPSDLTEIETALPDRIREVFDVEIEPGTLSCPDELFVFSPPDVVLECTARGIDGTDRTVEIFIRDLESRDFGFNVSDGDGSMPDRIDDIREELGW